jgi:hypothetical protein
MTGEIFGREADYDTADVAGNVANKVLAWLFTVCVSHPPALSTI